MGRLFGTDGIRGAAVTELTCELALNIGRASALVLSKHIKNGRKPNILVGKDTRISSDTLEAALIAGITSVGADVELLGVLPTPAVAFLINEFNADAGVVISASHNPVADNGIKLFSDTGEKLPDELEAEIEALILDNPETMNIKNGVNIGKIRSFYVGRDNYMNHIKDSVNADLRGMKLLIDCANGAAHICAEVFMEMGADCDFIGNEPNGLNINENCGSTHLSSLSERVSSGGYDAGIAFDGDADRCLFVDEKGGIVSGDKLIALLAKSMKEAGTLEKNTVVVTIMSNLGFHEYMRGNGITTISTNVGDRYVYEEMLKGGFNLGGENSGHVIMSDFCATGDGLMTAAMVLKIMKANAKPLSGLVAPIKDYPQKLIGIKVSADMRANWDKCEAITDIIRKAEGFFATNGRVNIRASGTEPLLRVMIESEKNEDVNMWISRIKEVINENCK